MTSQYNKNKSVSATFADNFISRFYDDGGCGPEEDNSGSRNRGSAAGQAAWHSEAAHKRVATPGSRGLDAMDAAVRYRREVPSVQAAVGRGCFGTTGRTDAQSR